MKPFAKITAAALALSFCVAGCGTSQNSAASSAPSQSTQEDKIVIGLSEPSAGWPYISAYMQAFEDAVAERDDVEAIILSADGDIQKQTNDIDDLIAQDVDIILVCSLDGKAIVPSLKKASDAGIPVLAVSNEPDASGQQYIVGYSGPDDAEQGRIAARLLAKGLNNQGAVVVIEGTPGQSTTLARSQGFEEELAKVAPDIKVLASQPADWDPAETKRVMEDFVTRYGGQFQGVFAQDDNMAAAAAEVLRDAGLLDSVKVVGTGGSKNGLAAIRDGLVYGTMDQSPTTDAKQGLELAIKVVKGEELPEQRNIIPMPEITKENVDQFKGEW